MMLSFEDLLTSFKNCQISDAENDRGTLGLFIDKLSESYRNNVKRSRERCLDEAFQLLKQIPEAELGGLDEERLLLLVRLLLSLQLQAVSVSTACRKVDQMLQLLAKLDYELVLREARQCLRTIVHAEQVLSPEDLQTVCMFLEDSVVGLQVCQELHLALLDKVSEFFSAVLRQASLRDEPLSYAAVKVCLQMFQLLSREIAPLVWDEQHKVPSVQKILQALLEIILGKGCQRDARLLAGTAVAMLINAAPERPAGGAAAWSLLQISRFEPWLLCVGTVEVRCEPRAEDGLETLAVIRGLLTCSEPDLLLTPPLDGRQTGSLLEGVFPLLQASCQRTECLYLAFEALTLWLKRVKACLAAIWRRRGVPLLADSSRLLQQLLHLVWTNADSPVEGVPECVRVAFGLVLELYDVDCRLSCNTDRPLYSTLLQRVVKQPWEAKARYQRLCSLLPFLGADVVLDRCVGLPDQLLKCLSSNHLAPCGAELYKGLLRQQRRELLQKASSCSELELARHWSKRWRPFLRAALTSDVVLLQSNSSALLLPCTFQTFPSAVDELLESLHPLVPGHLHAWACAVGCYRATTGGSPWSLRGSSTLETLQLALESADERVRLAALDALCCSLKSRDAPTGPEMSLMRTFLTHNLNCESSPFRQHLQAGLKKFLVRVRDGCLACVRGRKDQKRGGSVQSEQIQDQLDQGIGFVDWLGQLPYLHLAPSHTYQRKKTALLLLSAVLETCTDTWSPGRRKGQPPANMAALLAYARQKGMWSFFCRGKQLVLISCLEDSTNEIRELSAWLLLTFFQSSFPDDIGAAMLARSKRLLCSPRVQDAQTGALMTKVLLQKSHDQSRKSSEASSVVRGLVGELREHYLTARADVMLAARTRPVHGVLSALQRCLFESPGSVSDRLDRGVTAELLKLLEDLCVLLLGALHGDAPGLTGTDAPPSFCDMGNAIRALIFQASGGRREEEEECVLLSEEHSLVLTCCWVSLKEIGIFLGSLVEKMLSESEPSKCSLTREDLRRASGIFRNILLTCRHWGAVEGCCVGFTKFCAALLSSGDAEVRSIPADMLDEGLKVVQLPRSASVTRRAAGLPMLIMCVCSASETSKTRSLLSRSVQTLLEAARTPLPDRWDATLDLPQVCAVHSLQALVRASGLAAAVLPLAPAVAILSLSLLSSPCWAMRNAALQLFSSLCTRMLGQRPGGEGCGLHQRGMSPGAFFHHYPGLQLFLLAELRGAAQALQDPSQQAQLHLQPSLFPVLTLLAQLQPGVQDTAVTPSSFLPPLLQLSASPIYNVRVMASKALVAMTPPSEHMSILSKLIVGLPGSQEPCCHNRLHGQLLQIRALLEGAVCSLSDPSSDLSELLSRTEASVWLVTEAQHCPLVRAAYLRVAGRLRQFFSETFLANLNQILMCDLQKPQKGLQIGLASFYKQALLFLCEDSRGACQIWSSFSALSAELQLSLVAAVMDGGVPHERSVTELVQRVLQVNLREALSSHSVEYRKTYLAALAAAASLGGDSGSDQPLREPGLHEEPGLADCVSLLLGLLEDQRWGSELLSEALVATSLLLSRRPDSSLTAPTLERWCCVLEDHRSPESPEELRMACAEALCVAAASLSLREHGRAFTSRLVSTGLCLLQDQSQQVRMKAARFTSLLHRARPAEGHSSIYVMHVNKALQVLLDLLLKECWEEPRTLEVLLGYLPQLDLGSVEGGASDTGCSSLYEPDQCDVFREPSAMCVCALPYLLQMADQCQRSPAVARSLSAWAEENVPQVLKNLSVCKDLLPAGGLTAAWLALLLDPRLHSSLCSLFAQAAFVVRLLETCGLQHLCDPSALKASLREVFGLLGDSGLHFPPALTAAAAGVALGSSHGVSVPEVRGRRGQP